MIEECLNLKMGITVLPQEGFSTEARAGCDSRQGEKTKGLFKGTEEIDRDFV